MENPSAVAYVTTEQDGRHTFQQAVTLGCGEGLYLQSEPRIIYSSGKSQQAGRQTHTHTTALPMTELNMYVRY